MSKISAILLWPVGVAVILSAGALLASRSRGAVAAVPVPVTPPRSYGHVGGLRAGTATRYSDMTLAKRLAWFGIILIAGSAVIYAVMVPLGAIAVHAGPAIDKPIFHWTVAHRVHGWKDAMTRATEVGDKWTVWGAAATAAVCLAVTWRSNRWLPPVALGSLIVLDHFVELAIVHTVHRPGPPGSLGGFPSGGSDRAVVFYGLIAYLLWREFSGRRRAAIWAAAIVAALGFNEAYSRGYLAVHWFTDILAGLLLGCVELGLFIIAVRLAAGPAQTPGAASVPSLAAARPAPAPAREVGT